jgi:hypothetical protein
MINKQNIHTEQELWICNLLNHMSPVFEKNEPLTPQQSPGTNKSFPTRNTPVRAFIARAQPYL